MKQCVAIDRGLPIDDSGHHQTQQLPAKLAAIRQGLRLALQCDD